MKAMTKKTLSIALLLLSNLILTVTVSAQAVKSSAEAVRTFNACIRQTRPATLDCSADFVQNVFDFYNRGDDSVLKPLLAAGRSSDGALSQDLGVFYSEVVSKSSRRFLSAIAWRPLKQQRHLCWMAGATDGGGMPQDIYRRVRRSLSAIIRRSEDPLAPVAKVCLAEIKKVNLSDNR
jgi:hypothetical protein